MTDHDLHTLLRDHIEQTEPPSFLEAEKSITLGRRTLVRRRARRGLAAAALLGAAAVAVPMLMNHDVLPRGDRSSGMDSQTAAALRDYDASAMPTKLHDAADPVVARTAPDLNGKGTFQATDNQDTALPEKYWDKASGMSLTYGQRGDAHQLEVKLLHSASEAEGDAQKICAGELSSGYSFSCDVSTVNGDVVITRVEAARELDKSFGSPGWGAVTRDELRTGKLADGDPSRRPIKADEIYFFRYVKSVHSRTFLTVAQETVKAPTFAAAEKAFTVPTADLIDLVTDPSLVIPKPPTGKNGCSWMLHPEDITCGVKP